MTAGRDDDKPTPEEKRRVYVVFFLIAFAIDLAIGLVREGTYVPTLVGSAIMITSVLFYVYSCFRDR
jgi:hypothetical protein